MANYIIRRFLQSLVLLVIVSIVTFGLIHSAPGGPALLLDPDLSRQDAERISEELGLDDPLPIQYVRWLGNVLRGDLGVSYSNIQPVTALIRDRLPNTLLLAGVSLLIAVIIAIPVGVVSAYKRYSIWDYLATTLTFIGISIPVFWFGIMLIVLFAVTLRWLPAGDMLTPGTGFDFSDRLKHLILPSIVLSTASMAELTRYTRSGMIGVLSEDYIRTAKAKGLSERIVLVRHALKNGLIPVITVIGVLIPRAASGAAITEAVFAWPGMGRLAVEAATTRDYPLVMGITLTVAAMVIASNFVTDVLYGYLDPRITLN
ncbi:MAG: ABC transporter permease [Chloroflexota bacterium]|nr:ABC transporter permease [Chloroflexota bacterium]